MGGVQINEELLADSAYFADESRRAELREMFKFDGRRVLMGEGALDMLAEECARLGAGRVFLIHEQDPRHRPFDFARETKAAPPWITEILESHESLPWRRRNIGRKGVLDQPRMTAGFPPEWKEELPSRRTQGQTRYRTVPAAESPSCRRPRTSPRGPFASWAGRSPTRPSGAHLHGKSNI